VKDCELCGRIGTVSAGDGVRRRRRQLFQEALLISLLFLPPKGRLQYQALRLPRHTLTDMECQLSEETKNRRQRTRGLELRLPREKEKARHVFFHWVCAGP